jgi:hypothetical protein
MISVKTAKPAAQTHPQSRPVKHCYPIPATWFVRSSIGHCLGASLLSFLVGSLARLIGLMVGGSTKVLQGTDKIYITTRCNIPEGILLAIFIKN